MRPAAEEQVRFLQLIQRLLEEGSRVTSYKFALLHALADLAVVKGDDSGAALPLSTFDVAERVADLYWRQVKDYPGASEPLRQHTGSAAAILGLIRNAYRSSGGSLWQLRRSAAWEDLVGEVEAVVKKMPLWKLQTVGKARLDFLYANVGAGNTVTLKPGVAFCLRAFHPLITELVRSAWLRFVRRQNAQVLGDVSDLPSFLFGSERSDLSGYAQPLRDLQSDACFYCASSLRRAGAVDHFIPWSRYPVDLGHNFVLAHATCNGAKSDALAAVPHLERWHLRNHDHGEELAGIFDDRRLPHHQPTTSTVARWCYQQADSTAALLWLRKDQLVPVDPGCSNLI